MILRYTFGRVQTVQVRIYEDTNVVKCSYVATHLIAKDIIIKK